MMNIHFLRVSVGEEFESGLLGCFWLGIFHELSVKMSPNVRSHGWQVDRAVGWRLPSVPCYVGFSNMATSSKPARESQ